jgi:hypothetical protein
MLTVALLLTLAAFVVTIGAASNRVPLWPAVLLVVVVQLLQLLPIR